MDDSTLHATRLWTSAQPIVAAFVASVVRDRADRDDVMQETALAVLKSFETYEPSKPFKAWAIGVARNQIGLYLRRRKRDRLVFSEETIANLQATFLSETPAAKLDFLPECIAQLQGRARTLCDLRYEQDLKPAAIAEKVKMTANTVAKALQRIREQLRDCVEAKAAAEGASG
ncbi:sigma-70 family RNA polymerase sigma factor [Blastopirellula sp. JC732]|uniref:Sigma-70 family RNA polymerase sigma factor n=1 Tax=Blastopirellula sediminis TaxID=2894196 RepID=A0A9X1SFR8_9BACT|nr:sigma-70 family RNA polymerase sigma factor [Blastopirellula sediminis]MCC9609417.1 sigma-70 family RNA polymerase sigma factor [Blastopirellula sediminis]MCC9627806.1 sigma-70 family RNA polymerase sigma factor [Blastopirellula sediminis]